MITYLQDGWYTSTGKNQLKEQVLNGAIDMASHLLKQHVDHERVLALALGVRNFLHHLQAPHVPATEVFTDKERAVLENKLIHATDTDMVLQAFVVDCFEHVHTPKELRGLYLHLMHISHMMQVFCAIRSPSPEAPDDAEEDSKLKGA
jgi:hypothetical protein